MNIVKHRKDAALERRFQPIQVDEPSVEDTVAILKGLRDATKRIIVLIFLMKHWKWLLN